MDLLGAIAVIAILVLIGLAVAFSFGGRVRVWVTGLLFIAWTVASIVFFLAVGADLADSTNPADVLVIPIFGFPAALIWLILLISWVWAAKKRRNADAEE